MERTRLHVTISLGAYTTLGECNLDGWLLLLLLVARSFFLSLNHG